MEKKEKSGKLVLTFCFLILFIGPHEVEIMKTTLFHKTILTQFSNFTSRQRVIKTCVAQLLEVS